MRTNPRWTATVIFTDKSEDIFDFDEFVELGDWIESGQAWRLIESISIKLAQRAPIGRGRK